MQYSCFNFLMMFLVDVTVYSITSTATASTTFTTCPVTMFTIAFNTVIDVVLTNFFLSSNLAETSEALHGSKGGGKKSFWPQEVLYCTSWYQFHLTHYSCLTWLVIIFLIARIIALPLPPTPIPSLPHILLSLLSSLPLPSLAFFQSIYLLSLN